MDHAKMKPLFEQMPFIEQFVESVISYTSRYNNIMSVSYAPDNIIGKPAKYPAYGDFPDTYMLRSYGKWWAKSEGAQMEYMPQDIGPVVSEDYIILKFEQPVIATKIVIYEIYNPGAVVRLWGGRGNGNWSLLWEGPPQECAPSSRLFSPPLRVIEELIYLIRIDFNQSRLEYHTSIDAVLLAGHKSKSKLQTNIILSGILQMDVDSDNKYSVQFIERNKSEESPFSILPYEVIVYIFGYLDLKSLCSCAQVNRTFHSAAADSTLYRNVCLKRYWHRVSDQTLQHFIPKCNFLRKLDLSWCGNNSVVSESGFIRFMSHCGKQLTHLSLGNCYFVQFKALEVISNCADLIDLRLRHVCPNRSDNFLQLANLKNLRALDLYSTNIDDQSLVKILKNNPNLEHLTLDLCEQLAELDLAAETLSTNNKKLRTFSCWKTHSVTSDGIRSLAKLPNLRELDVGWCLVLSEPGDCLTHIAQGCPNLKRLIISGWRGLGDHQLLPLIRNCTRIRQLDLLGTRNITGDICERALNSFHDLELLDVSFCDSITPKQGGVWNSPMLKYSEAANTLFENFGIIDVLFLRAVLVLKCSN